MSVEDLQSRAAYLRGLADGLDLDEKDKKDRIILKIIDFLDDVAEEMEQLRTDYDELFEYAEAIDEDLTELEDDFYEDDDEDDDEDDEDDDEYEDGFTIECPNCRELVVVGDDLLDQDEAIEVKCPGCGEVVLVDDDDWDDEDLEDLLEEEEEEEEEEEPKPKNNKKKK